MLELDRINVFIKQVHVLRNVSLTVPKNEIVCLLGRNGAGKTTTIKSILGLIPVKSGRIIYNGEDITHLPPEKRVKLGIGYAPEDRRIYPDFTVEENIDLAARLIPQSERERVKEEIFAIFPELKPLRNRRGLYLSGGEQKMLAIARAMAMKPSLILLDEPLEGLAPKIVLRLSEAIREIKRKGISLLIAESNVANALKIATYIYVIERGEIIYKGRVEELHENQEIMKIVRGL